MTLFRSRIIKLFKLRNLSTAPQAVRVQEELTQTFKTTENNPVNHDERHLGKFYTIPSGQLKTIFSHGLTNEYKKIITTFTEACLMVRKPALDIFECLAQTNYKKPVNKYVIYGGYGCGKSSTLLHVIHHGYCSNKIIVHIPWATHWYLGPKEVANSTTKDGLVDLPIDAAAWLVNFKKQNADVLARTDLKLSKSYEWSPEDTSLKNSPLLDTIGLGIERIKYACDIVDALMTELKEACIAGKCKVLVAIDGFNALFADTTRVKDEQKQMVPSARISLTRSFLNITKSDWCNGEVVVVVDEKATEERRNSHLPRYLLSEKGFEHMDPFLPIAVENYSRDEFDTVIEYYKNRKWIRELTADGHKELKVISGANPRKLMNYCKHL
ncbi:small ribosomal subunit protein mS29 [Phymastichus coffea]|uniref:small ribosomal subunit protein mS29 n=1 Tax=Phymastichus coffea TaxID=108790 RepID=UPI00273C7743|nr:small ribosomal subunit protein mS29 [Phymastichus coffea]